MEAIYQKKWQTVDHQLILIGFGSIGQAVLPLIMRHLDVKPQQITIINKNKTGEQLAKALGVRFVLAELMAENFKEILGQVLKPHDFIINLSVNVSSIDLIRFAQASGALYIDTCIEPWAGGYTDASIPLAHRSNYALRESALKLRQEVGSSGPTAILTHGANPGLVSHFVKRALMNMAADQALLVNEPQTQAEWARLANQLNIKAIHIAERDTQVAAEIKKKGEFVNTWSVDGFISEGCQPAELGWGTHERALPPDGATHEFGSQCAIYLKRPGAATRVRTWTPLAGAFHGFLITHSESISIADYFTLKVGDEVTYRPTVHYAYHPCEDAVLSLNELAGSEWSPQAMQRILFDEITQGVDELGVLLMGNEQGAYWYGSALSIDQTRKLVPSNNATSLQVAVSVLAGVIWGLTFPDRGVLEPDEINYRFILDITHPYLGDIGGHYTDWTPLQARETLFSEDIDRSDPWQFKNIRVA